MLPLVQNADQENLKLPSGQGAPRHQDEATHLIKPHDPNELQAILQLETPLEGLGSDGLLSAAKSVLSYSVNTWSAGFLDKLYSSTDPPGVAAELLLATLNTNAHVYAVSPALSCVEKHVTQTLARLFGFAGAHAGGVSMPGGAAANTTSMLVARNVMFPSAKTGGVASIPEPLAAFASADSHYSVAAAAVTLGLGSSAVQAVAVDEHGAMLAPALASAIEASISRGQRPFYVCATAGTTVRGAYDPLPAIADVCARFRVWLHVDACWGGPAIFSTRHKHKLAGSHRAQTVAINPHKMLGVPVTCSFLLAADLRTFSSAHKLANAGYLFHNDARGSNGDTSASDTGLNNLLPPGLLAAEPAPADVFDLASLTPQCGRRADSLKFYLAWTYHGSAGFAAMVDRAFAAASLLAQLLRAREDVQVLGTGDPPCAQVCFWYVGGSAEGGSNASAGHGSGRASLRDVQRSEGQQGRETSKVTREIVRRLVRRGWMIDFAPGGLDEHGEERGEFLRVVMNRNCGKGIVGGLVAAIGEVGAQVVEEALGELVS